MQSESAKQTKQDIYDMGQIDRRSDNPGGYMSFNKEYGMVEAILRGFRAGFLLKYDYDQLCNCDSLDDLKLALSDTDYKLAIQRLQNVQVESNLEMTRIIYDAIVEKNVAEFEFVRKTAVGPLATFIEYTTYEYLIKNIQLVISSLIKGRSNMESLLAKCDPRGRSPHLKSVLSFDNLDGDKDGLMELYRTVLVDTPVGKYFSAYFKGQIKSDQAPREIQRHYDEAEIDIITNMLQKLWLEDFYSYTQELGGATAEIMKELLEFEADRRAIEITRNSFATDLNSDINRGTKRRDLYCNFGRLYPEATFSSEPGSFAHVTDMSSLGESLRPYQEYYGIFTRSQEGPREEQHRRFDDLLAEMEVAVNRKAFESQGHFAVFYAYTKLKLKEERNLKWILGNINIMKFAENARKARNRWVRIF